MGVIIFPVLERKPCKGVMGKAFKWRLAGENDVHTSATDMEVMGAWTYTSLYYTEDIIRRPIMIVKLAYSRNCGVQIKNQNNIYTFFNGFIEVLLRSLLGVFCFHLKLWLTFNVHYDNHNILMKIHMMY